MDRFTISEAWDYIETTKWAYATIDGLLRCPDCNSNLDCTWEEDYDHYPFHANEADGACSVTTEECVDCGVLLVNDEAGAPWEIFSKEKQARIRVELLSGQLAALLAS